MSKAVFKVPCKCGKAGAQWIASLERVGSKYRFAYFDRRDAGKHVETPAHKASFERDCKNCSREPPLTPLPPSPSVEVVGNERLTKLTRSGCNSVRLRMPDLWEYGPYVVPGMQEVLLPRWTERFGRTLCLRLVRHSISAQYRHLWGDQTGGHAHRDRRYRAENDHPQQRASTRQLVMSDDQFVDYYALLRITPDASIKEIEGAYKLEVRYWHPDRLINRPIDEQKQAERHFVELGRAREVLSDSDKRLRYDEIYREWTASLGCTTAPADSDPDPSVMSMSELRAWMGLPGPKLGHLQQAATLDRNAAWERAKVLLQRGVFENAYPSADSAAGDAAPGASVGPGGRRRPCFESGVHCARRLLAPRDSSGLSQDPSMR